MGGSPSVQAPQAPDAGKEFTSALNAYASGAGQLYNTEAQYQPMYNQLNRQLQQENISSYGQQFIRMLPEYQAAADATQTQATQAAVGRQQSYGAQAYQSMLNANPAMQGLSNQAATASAATADTYLTGLRDTAGQQAGAQARQFQDLSSQVGRDVVPINEQLQGLYTQTGEQTAKSAAELTGIRDKFAADTRSDIWKQTQGEVSGQLGKLDPLTQQLSDTARQQLALGGSLSEQQKQDAQQAARAAYSSRGLLNSNPAIAQEVLSRDQYSQQLLQQREQFAGSVDPLVQQQIQQRTGNAMQFSQANEALTQANLGQAGQLTQGIASLQQGGTAVQMGLQGQIAGNLSQARQQQAGLLGQATAAQQWGTQTQAGLQGTILDELYRQQSFGAQINQYLGNAGQQNWASLNAPAAGGAYAQQATAENVYGIGGASLFESSGILSMTNQNQMAQMNAQGSANMSNAQAQSAAQGQRMAAGAAIAGTVITSAVLL